MPTLQSVAALHSARVTDRNELSPGIVLLGLHAPELVRVTRPGQFVMVKPPLGQRAAIALGIYEAEGQRASLMFVVCGDRTRELASVSRGHTLELFGPLGNGFDLSGNPRDVAVVAGGVGIASVLLPVQALLRSGARVRLFYGARSKPLLVDAERFARSGCEVITATDDGSAGHRGVVTDLLQNASAPERILACGPSPMLRAVGRIAQQRNIPAQLSLEETFACGVGACWGCVVPIDPASPQAPRFPAPAATAAQTVYARICKEGPVFRAQDLRW